MGFDYDKKLTSSQLQRFAMLVADELWDFSKIQVHPFSGMATGTGSAGIVLVNPDGNVTHYSKVEV